MSIHVKICGVTSAGAAAHAVAAGADEVGLVFFDKSPRNVTVEAAAEIAAAVPTGTRVTGLFVDAEDAKLEAAIASGAINSLQLHGKETPDRVEDIKTKFGLPVMKALGVSTVKDIDAAKAFTSVADRILFDAKPPKDASRPGGLGVPFDWTLLAAVDVRAPWMLSGGLTPDTVAAAVAGTHDLPGFQGVDVSSGVESAPGEKDPYLVRAFIEAAHGAVPSPPRGEG